MSVFPKDLAKFHVWSGYLFIVEWFHLSSYLKFSLSPRWCFNKCYDGFIFIFPNVFFISFIAIKTNFIFTFYYMNYSHMFSSVRNSMDNILFSLFFLIAPRFIRYFGTSKTTCYSWDQHAFCWNLLGLKASVIQDPRSAVGPMFSYSQQLM